MPNGEHEDETIARIRAAATEGGGVRREQEIMGIYPIGGEDLIKELREATPEQFPEVMTRYLAIKEGLVFGPDYWDLENPQQLLFLHNLFTTVESSQDRPQDLYYPEIEVNNKIYQGVRETKAKARKEGRPALTDEEKKRVGELTGMETHRDARGLVDVAFIQRMAACEDADKVANLLDKDPSWRPSIKPDKGHWRAFFSGEFGEGVDRVLRRIVAAATPVEELERIKRQRPERFSGELEPIRGIKPTIYAKGFEATEAFKTWLSDLLKTANGRMDIVWAAWRVALLWEIPAQLGISTEGGKIKIADPPIGNDLMTWTIDIDNKRTMEWGWDASGKRVRETKYLTHTGYPLSLGKIHEICQSYLYEAEVDLKGGQKATLWQIWWERGVNLANHEKFPWALTDLQPAGLDTKELPPASFGGWFLKRQRAHKVVEDIRSRPSLSGKDNLSDPDFFAGKLRNWEKVLGVIPDYDQAKKETWPENSPRTVWLAGILLHSHWKADREIPAVKDKQELSYRTYYPAELWSYERKGKVGGRPISVWEILDHAIQCGFLREVDKNWIVDKLALPKPI